MDMLKSALEQGQRLESLLDRVGTVFAARRASKDRVLHWLQDAFVFQQDQNTVQNLVFNVPKGYDFEAARLNVYLELRRVVTDPTRIGESDLVFRPTTWYTSYATSAAPWGPRMSADALVELTYAAPDGKTRRYQNAAFYVAQTFSDYTNINVGDRNDYNRSESPAGMVFDPFYLLARGSTLTCRVTPTYSGTSPDEQVVHEYRVRGVLEGYKRL